MRAYREAETPFTPAVVFPALAAARAHRGDADGAHEALDMWDALGAARGRRYRPLVDAFVGRVDAAHDALERPAFRVFAGMQPTDAFFTVGRRRGSCRGCGRGLGKGGSSRRAPLPRQS